VGEGITGKALVTGATGFIGRRLVDALRRQGIAVGVLTRDVAKAHTLWPDNMVNVAEADLGVPETIGDACSGVQTLFHLAGHAHAEDEGSAAADALHERVTVTGTQALLDAAVGAGVQRAVFVSSVKAIGEGSSECLDERGEAEPASAYGRAKREAEQLVLEAGGRHGFHASVLRLPLVYGPGVKGNLLRMMAGIDRGRFPPLPETGNKRSMVHVDDVVRAMLLVTQHPQADGQVYIVTDGQTYSTRRIYELICKGLGKQPWRWSIPQSLFRAGARMGDLIEAISGRRFVFDSNALAKLLGSAWYSSEKITRELGYRPTRTLDDSIKEMVAVYKRTED
jgi:UDP-glucose 4-epimerase